MNFLFGIIILFIFIIKNINCEVLNLTENLESAIKDENAYVIKFYSEMCGSCKEFAPTFDDYAKKVNKKLNVGIVNIDNKTGMEQATKVGAMDGGIPAVYLIISKTKKGIIPIFDGDGDLPTALSMLKKTRTLVEGLNINDYGKYLKK